jgi:1,4-dihydroxy-2-naphthoate octaprenyltransferase
VTDKSFVTLAVGITLCCLAVVLYAVGLNYKNDMLMGEGVLFFAMGGVLGVIAVIMAGESRRN